MYKALETAEGPMIYSPIEAAQIILAGTLIKAGTGLEKLVQVGARAEDVLHKPVTELLDRAYEIVHKPLTGLLGAVDERIHVYMSSGKRKRDKVKKKEEQEKRRHETDKRMKSPGGGSDYSNRPNANARTVAAPLRPSGWSENPRTGELEYIESYDPNHSQVDKSGYDTSTPEGLARWLSAQTNEGAERSRKKRGDKRTRNAENAAKHRRSLGRTPTPSGPSWEGLPETPVRDDDGPKVPLYKRGKRTSSQFRADEAYERRRERLEENRRWGF